MSVINKQVKSVMSNFPPYLGDCRVVNFTTKQWVTWTIKSRVFEILRVEVLVAGENYYLDLIVDGDSYEFLGLGQSSNKQIDFSISLNVCWTLSLADYLEKANGAEKLAEDWEYELQEIEANNAGYSKEEIEQLRKENPQF